MSTSFKELTTRSEKLPRLRQPPLNTSGISFVNSSRHLAKVPSFHGFSAVSSVTSRIKRANRSEDTRHELILSLQLRRLGIRFKKHQKMLPGNPDLVFPSPRMVVFCDGDFWHGRKWRQLRVHLASGSNSTYWIAKIQSNRSRDKKINAQLFKLGWCVIRVWEKDIVTDPEQIARKISHVVDRRRGAKNHTGKVINV